MSTAPPSFLTDSIVDSNESVVDSTVLNDGFYPDISLQDFMSKHQVSDDYSAQRRLQCLTEAVRQINSEIKSNKTKWKKLGYADFLLLPDCPADINCTNKRCFISNGETCQSGNKVITDCESLDIEPPFQPRVDAYLDAIYCFALKLLAERYRNTDTTQYAEKKATEYENQVDYWNGECIRHTRFVTDKVGATMECRTL